MSDVLVDSSVWIAYSKGDHAAFPPSELIALNRICINELIYSELLPSLHAKKEKHLIGLLKEVKIYPLAIDWDEIVRWQTLNIKNGINKVGISDLIILQNAMHNNLSLYSLDKRFSLMKNIHKFTLYSL